MCGKSRTLVIRQCLLADFFVAFLTAPVPAFACRLALVLAIDVSVSVDQRDYALQRDGLANALRAPDVVGAFLASSSPVALAAYEWSGPRHARTVLNWTVMASASEMYKAADRIESLVRYQTGSTSLGYALSYGADVLATAPPCGRQTLDLSGDGRNNDGFSPKAAYRNRAFDGITVNALAIGGSEPLDSLVEYLERNVIRGTGAFVEVARNHEEFETAMRRKLIREVKTVAVSRLRSSP